MQEEGTPKLRETVMLMAIYVRASQLYSDYMPSEGSKTCPSPRPRETFVRENPIFSF